MKKFTTLTLILSISTTSILLSQCGSVTKKTLISTGLGCGAGLALGTIYDEMQRKKDSKDRRKDVFAIFKKKKEQNQGKIVGLATGCLAGLGVGLYLDLMYDDIQNQFGSKGIQLEKVPDEKGETKELLVKMDGDINFQLNSAELQGVAKENVTKLKEALEAYPETGVKIWGHTDKSGTRAYNEKLSFDRAKSVANYLNLASSRVVEIKGWAWDKPIDETGKSPANRRVEVRIVPLN
jgi:outer membrane protein OmpA-like peptidoglycan-associated protein